MSQPPKDLAAIAKSGFMWTVIFAGLFLLFCKWMSGAGG